MTTHMPEPSLERALAALASDIAFPEPTDLRAAVLDRIQTSAAPRRIRARRGWLQPAIAAGFALLFVSALLVTALPGARRAVADLLGFDSLTIEVTEEPLPELGRELLLGDPVTPARAKSAFGVLPVLDPTDYPGTRAVYLTESPVDMLTVVYGDSAALPPVALYDVSLLISAIDADLHSDFVKKVAMTREARVRPVTVRGLPGYWVSGDHAFFMYSRSDGFEQVESARIANSVLVWEEAGLLLRVEGELTRGQALRIAEAIQLHR